MTPDQFHSKHFSAMRACRRGRVVTRETVRGVPVEARATMTPQPAPRGDFDDVESHSLTIGGRDVPQPKWALTPTEYGESLARHLNQIGKESARA